MDLWWYLIAKNNHMFRPTAAIFRSLQFCSKSIIHMPILGGDAEISSWPLLAETCSYFFLLLNTIINPYYHSCVFMTDIYLTISLFYTQRGWHTSEFPIDFPKNPPISNFQWKSVRWELSCSIRTGRHDETVAVRNFATPPKTIC